MNLYIGIDPSENSTGVCILYDKNINYNFKAEFYIVKPNKLTKKETAVEKEIPNFEYKLYNKQESNAEDNHDNELAKTYNFINILNIIEEIINDTRKKFTNELNIYICQEGISYGSSIRTRSVFDLAGLNYMLRGNILKYKEYNLIIATPGEIKKFATGKGNADKEMITNMFKYIFPTIAKLPKYDDLADAYFMASYAKEINENR